MRIEINKDEKFNSKNSYIKEIMKNVNLGNKRNNSNTSLSDDDCPHKKGSVIEIFQTNNLPTITGDNTKYYDGFCVDCEKMVYGRTGKKVIRWTTDRNYAFGD